MEFNEYLSVQNFKGDTDGHNMRI